MKFTIATIHSAYGLSYIPNGKIIEQELSTFISPDSLVDINWLKPSEDHKYIADMMFADEIIGLERVEDALISYLTEQFNEDCSRLLWMPSFHKKHLFCQHFLKNKSVFDVGNTIFSKVLTDIATEVEVLIFHVGNKSLTKLGSPKLLNEKLLVGDMDVQISGYEVAEKSRLHQALLKSYSLNILNRQEGLNLDEDDIKDDVLLEQFSKFGKLEGV